MKNPLTGLARGLRRRQTDAEKNLWAALRNEQTAKAKFRRQEPIGEYIVDFVSFEKKLIIELDGSQHSETAIRLADNRRTEWLESPGFRVLRFLDNDVLQNMEGVFDEIERVLDSVSPSPSLSHRGRGKRE